MHLSTADPAQFSHDGSQIYVVECFFEFDEHANHVLLVLRQCYYSLFDLSRRHTFCEAELRPLDPVYAALN